MKKKCKVVMLATDEKGSLNLGYGNILYQGTSLPFDNKHKNQHLYIVSDDEIKEGDWMINTNGDTLLKYDSKNEGDNTWREFWRKIIVTTDGSIGYTDHRVSPVPNFCAFPQPSQQFIEYFVFEYNRGNIITEVMVEFEEKLIPNDANGGMGYPEEYINILKINQDNTINIDVVKDSWNIKEMEEIHVAIIKQGCLYEGGEWSDEHERLVRLEFNKYAKENL